MKTRLLSIAILLLGAAGAANAEPNNDGHWHAGKSPNWFREPSAPTFQAPEIDPVSMVSALTLLGGAFAVLRGCRPKS
jgi:hypothetical protein